MMEPEAATRSVLQKAALTNLAILTRKHLCWGLFLKKFAGLQNTSLE